MIQEKFQEAMKDNLGKCYELSWKWVSSHSGYNLVHGYISQKSSSKVIDHAWTEKGDEVYDPVMEKTLSKTVYYAIFEVEIYKSYTRAEAMKLGSSTGVYGPWHEIPKGKIRFPGYEECVMKTIKIQKEFQIPGTDIILEKGDQIRIKGGERLIFL